MNTAVLSRAAATRAVRWDTARRAVLLRKPNIIATRSYCQNVLENTTFHHHRNSHQHHHHHCIAQLILTPAQRSFTVARPTCAQVPNNAVDDKPSSKPVSKAEITSSESKHATDIEDISKSNHFSRDTLEYTPVKKTKEPFSMGKIGKKIKEEAQHYWHGTKLLGSELKISLRLVAKLLAQGELSRREQRQLSRTMNDMARLVPFVVIVVIPFMELLLPVLLKLFPNMLPSTFESKVQEEAKKKKLLDVRMKMAKYLEETSKDVNIKGTSVASAAKEFTKFFDRARLGDLSVPPNEVLEIARKFPDELVLSNLSRPQLVSMSRYMNLVAFGTDSFLRHQIERRLKYLTEDDKLILKEGVDNLSLPELQQICSSRGIRTYGSSPYKMRKELDQWLDLHVKQQVPSSLLILSRAFLMNHPSSDVNAAPVISEASSSSTVDSTKKDSDASLANQTATAESALKELDKLGLSVEELEALKKKELEASESIKATAQAISATLTSLPHQVVHEARLNLNEQAGTATAKQKLDVILEQEELIADELEEEEALEDLRRKEKQKKRRLAEEKAAAERAASQETSEKPSSEKSSSEKPSSEKPTSSVKEDGTKHV